MVAWRIPQKEVLIHIADNYADNNVSEVGNCCDVDLRARDGLDKAVEDADIAAIVSYIEKIIGRNVSETEKRLLKTRRWTQ